MEGNNMGRPHKKTPRQNRMFIVEANRPNAKKH